MTHISKRVPFQVWVEYYQCTSKKDKKSLQLKFEFVNGGGISEDFVKENKNY